MHEMMHLLRPTTGDSKMPWCCQRAHPGTSVASLPFPASITLARHYGEVGIVPGNNCNYICDHAMVNWRSLINCCNWTSCCSLACDCSIRASTPSANVEQLQLRVEEAFGAMLVFWNAANLKVQSKMATHLIIHDQIFEKYKGWQTTKNSNWQSRHVLFVFQQRISQLFGSHSGKTMIGPKNPTLCPLAW